MELGDILDIVGGPYSTRNTLFGNSGTAETADTEIMVSLMVFSMGGIVLTVLWKIAIEVRREVEGGNISLVPPVE